MGFNRIETHPRPYMDDFRSHTLLFRGLVPKPVLPTAVYHAALVTLNHIPVEGVISRGSYVERERAVL